MAEFKLPDVGEGLTEAEIVSWKVKAGDTVTINQVLVEIETAKSLVELPSPYAGVAQQLMVPEGETVPVGTPIIAFGYFRHQASICARSVVAFLRPPLPGIEFPDAGSTSPLTRGCLE